MAHGQLRQGCWLLAPRGCQQVGAALELGDLGELELDRSLAPEDVDEHLELELVFVDLGDLAGEVGEGALAHSHALAHLVLEAGAGPLYPRALRPEPPGSLHRLSRQPPWPWGEGD